MATGHLPEPGTEWGPCEDVCEHRDCRETRKMAEANCTICEKQIGYDVRFYDNGDGTLCHALCLEIEIEKEQESRK